MKQVETKLFQHNQEAKASEPMESIMSEAAEQRRRVSRRIRKTHPINACGKNGCGGHIEWNDSHNRRDDEKVEGQGEFFGLCIDYNGNGCGRHVAENEYPTIEFRDYYLMLVDDNGDEQSQEDGEESEGDDCRERTDNNQENARTYRSMKRKLTAYVKANEGVRV